MSHNVFWSLAIAASALATTAFVAEGQIINEVNKLLPIDGGAGERFGWAVAIDGSVAIVGARYDDNNMTGSAYLFDTETGHQLAKLVPSDSPSLDIQFGTSVAVDGSMAAIGASADSVNGLGSGSAYLFDAMSGQEIAKILPEGGGEGDRFGTSVAIYGSTMIVGAPGSFGNGGVGSAYLFDTDTGQQIARLIPDGEGVLDAFGLSVSLSSTTAVVGAPQDDDNGSNAGSAYVFDASTGEQIAKLQPNDAESFDNFGYSVAVNDDVILVGARWDDDSGDVSGSAYLFDATTFQQLAKLLPSDGEAGNRFGTSLALSESTAVIGAFQNTAKGVSLSAYLFDYASGEQIAKLLPSDNPNASLSAMPVAISETTAVIGAPSDVANGGESGSAYLFIYSSCPADLAEPFGTLDLADISAFVTAFTNQEPLADLAPDGLFDLADITVFVNSFTAGCP